MRHTFILVVCFVLVACDQRASTPTPGGPTTPVSVSDSTKTPGSKDPAVKNDKTNTTAKTDGDKTPGSGDTKTTDAGKSSTSDKPEKIEKITRTEEEWKSMLSEEEYYVLRKKGTERAFTGKYDKFFKPGKYVCAGCGLELFTSHTKFDSGCGWPAFYAAKAGDRVKLHEDNSFGMKRVEVVCARCDGHLGHVFDDAPQTPTGERFCINSVAIKFIPAEGPLRENIADEPEKK